jgi:hypothetical protein
MDTTTLIKLMAGLMPFTPVTNDIIDNTNFTEETPDESEEEETEETAVDPTMEDAVAAHNSSVPTIEGMDSINVQVGDSFDPLAGVYAIDNQDGNITDQIEVSSNNVDTSSAGNYTVSYRVENSRNGYYEYTRQITVSDAPSDPIAPIPSSNDDSEAETEESSNEDAASSVVFNGLDDVNISEGSDFDPREGVSVLDSDGLDITDKLYISGEVDTSTPGEYTIAYAVFDLFGEPYAEARTVTVE